MAKAEALLANLDAFVGFVRNRVRDPDLAADVVQDALAKALAHLDDVGDDERLDAWFYRILRNTIIDLSRRRAVRLSTTAVEGDVPATDENEAATACRCLLPLIDQLEPDVADAVRAVDLDGEPLEAVAARQGITVGNLKVRRTRARQQLRVMLDEACHICAKHGCVDCTCGG